MSKPTKYGNAKPTYKGVKFDSGLEMLRYRYLQGLEKKGKITGLRRQVRYEIIPKQGEERAAHYIADFVYTRASDGVEVVEDTKGVKTDAYILKRKLMLQRYGIRIREVSGAGEPIETKAK